jgi:glutamyl-tRNA reductase
MSEIIVVGLSHSTSSVALREQLAVPEGALKDHVQSVAKNAGLEEAVVISTCNRVEVYGVGDGDSATRIKRALSGKVPLDELEPHLYERRGDQAVRHAFRVASSLDSMVVGEPQILGQFKEAYAVASEAGLTGSLLERCFARAFAVAKRVRTETAIASGNVSVSSVATDLARKIFGDLEARRVLLIGAGKMGESAAKHLRNQGARLFVLNRSMERAVELAKACDGEPRSLAELPSELGLADVAIVSTASDRFVVTQDLMKQVLKQRKFKPLFFIDISVPRNVDPRVGQMENVYVYDVDDLSKVANENIAARRREADAAERIVEAEAKLFEEWRRSLDLKPTIVAIRAHVRGILEAELERTRPRLTGDPALSKMLDAATNKLVHKPLAELRKAGEAGDVETIATIERLFVQDAAPAMDVEDAPVPSGKLKPSSPS